jgi:putative chitinase
MTLTAAHLKAIIPGIKQSVIETFLPHLNKYMPQYGIDNRLRVAAFIAQLIHESGGLRYVREIATGSAYEGRADLGNHYKGDGVKFKGRGLIQITGRSNYTAASHALFGDDRGLQS